MRQQTMAIKTLETHGTMLMFTGRIGPEDRASQPVSGFLSLSDDLVLVGELESPTSWVTTLPLNVGSDVSELTIRRLMNKIYDDITSLLERLGNHMSSGKSTTTITIPTTPGRIMSYFVEAVTGVVHTKMCSGSVPVAAERAVCSGPERACISYGFPVTTFISRNVDRAENARFDVLAFIEKIWDHVMPVSHGEGSTTSTIAGDVIAQLFEHGYCWHFAHILKDTFGCGDVCWAAPYGHFVWMFDDIPYDINGVYDGEADKFIPEEYLGNSLFDFLRIPGKAFCATEDDINQIINRYDRDNCK